MPTVHVSLPLTGPSAEIAAQVLDGVRHALAAAPEPPELLVADSGFSDTAERAVANARAAAADPAALAYLGDFHSFHVAATQPILAAAGLLQVAPVATRADLAGPTLILLTAGDHAGAEAIADWLVAQGAGSLLVVHDHDDDYGIPVAALCAAAARARGLAVRSRPVWDHDEEMAADAAGMDAVLYVGVAGSGAVDLYDGLHALDPGQWLLGSEAVAAPWLAEHVAPGTAARTRCFVPQTDPFATYGERAMELIRASLGADRASTLAAALAAHRPVTSAAYVRLRIADGTFVPDA